MPKYNYTFGDCDQASERLRRLAELYEPETRELLQHGGLRAPQVAVDLGCGPGWSTRLLHDVLNPDRTVGLDTSERYISEARSKHGSDLEFHVHDVVRAPFPVASPNVMFCRFLLTHLNSLSQVLTIWATISAPGGLLFIHETESLETDNPQLCRYYELLAELQQHYNQVLLVGAALETSLRNSGWNLIESDQRILEKPAPLMAELHLANLRTWRHDEYARESFDANEMDSLEVSLERIARGIENAGVVSNGARQIIARRP